MMTVAVDHHSGKLYFTDVHPQSFRTLLMESNLDGTNRRVLINDIPTVRMDSLTVDDTTIYWTDRATNSIWKVYKNGTKMRKINSYENMDPDGWNSYSMQILTRYSVDGVDCKAVLDNDKCTTMFVSLVCISVFILFGVIFFGEYFIRKSGISHNHNEKSAD